MQKKTLTNRELRSERADIWRRLQPLVEKVQKPNCDRATIQEFEAAEREFRAIDAQLRIVEDIMRGDNAPPREQIDGGYAEQRSGASYSVTRRDEDPKHRRAFNSFLRRGAADLTTEDRAALFERRDMGTGGAGAYPGAAGSTGGFFVPVGFVDRIEDALKWYGPMLDGGPGMPTIMDTDTGQPLPFPAVDDTSSIGEQIGEGQQVSTGDVNVQQVVFGSWKFSTRLVKCSIELLQDSAFDVESFLITEFSRRLGRILNTKTTAGAGTTEPLGILTAIMNGGNTVAAVGSSGNDGTSAGTNTIGTDDLIAVEHAVDPAYRNMGVCRYMLHDSTLKKIKQLKDRYGHPIFQESMRDGTPDTINGYRFCINNDLDVLQTNPSSPPVTRRTVIFGDLTKHVIRRVREMSVLRLTERFADFGIVAFIGFARYDSNNLDIGHRALAALTNTY